LGLPSQPVPNIIPVTAAKGGQDILELDFFPNFKKKPPFAFFFFWIFFFLWLGSIGRYLLEKSARTFKVFVTLGKEIWGPNGIFISRKLYQSIALE